MEFLNAQTFKEKIFDYEKETQWKYKGTKPAIIDFYADWCGPCRMLAPVLEEIEKQYGDKIDIFKVDTEASPELAAVFGIRGIPSILFIPADGSQPAMVTGFIPKEAFEEAIEEIFKIPPPRIIRV